jgi:hypothetical protein
MRGLSSQDGAVIDVPTEPGQVLEVAGRLGFVRETNYGRLFGSTRIRHARTAFTGTGGRPLRGCHADLDSRASTLAVLGREKRA